VCVREKKKNNLNQCYFFGCQKKLQRIFLFLIYVFLCIYLSTLSLLFLLNSPFFLADLALFSLTISVYSLVFFLPMHAPFHALISVPTRFPYFPASSIELSNICHILTRSNLLVDILNSFEIDFILWSSFNSIAQTSNEYLPFRIEFKLLGSNLSF